MSDQVAQAVAVGELPAPWEGDNEPPVARLNRLQILTRGIGRIRDSSAFLAGEQIWFGHPGFSETRESPSTRTAQDAFVPTAASAQEVASTNRSA